MGDLPLDVKADHDFRRRATVAVRSVIGDFLPGESIDEWAKRIGFWQPAPATEAPVWQCAVCTTAQPQEWNGYVKEWQTVFPGHPGVWQHRLCPRCLAAKEAAARAALGPARHWALSENVPLAFQEARLNQLDERTEAAIEAWLGQSHPLPLVLVGDCGTGKTHAAFAACYRWAERYEQFPVIHKAKRWLADIKRVIGEAGDPDEECERLADLRTLLVVDDLLADRVTEFAAGCWYTIVDHRVDHRLPLLITINPPPGTKADRARQAALVDLEKAGMFRVAERLQNATWVVMAGKNWRRPA